MSYKYVIDYLPNEKMYVAILDGSPITNYSRRYPSLSMAQSNLDDSGNKYRLSSLVERMAREAAGIEIEPEIDWECGNFDFRCPQCDGRMLGVDVGSSAKCGCGLTWRVEVKAVGTREEGP